MVIENEVHECIKGYVTARKQLIDIGNKYPELFSGNDNMIGRIGEYYGLIYLSKLGQKPKKAESKSNQGYDLIDEITNIKTQIKVITCENKKGKTVRLVEPWDQLILFIMDEDYMIEKLGFINKTQFNRALEKESSWSCNPIVKRTMIGKNGLIGKYGVVEEKPLL